MTEGCLLSSEVVAKLTRADGITSTLSVFVNELVAKASELTEVDKISDEYKNSLFMYSLHCDLSNKRMYGTGYIYTLFVLL
jgi:hypothetical protein